MPAKPPSLGQSATRAAVRPRDLRPSSSARGYDSRWQAYVRVALAREPLCRRCNSAGVASLASLIDHIQPVDGPDDPLFWCESNHQPLCRRCHAIKTHADRRAGLTRKEAARKEPA